MYSMSLTGLRSFGTGAGASRSDAPAKSFVWTCSSENVFLTSDDGLMVPSRCVSGARTASLLRWPHVNCHVGLAKIHERLTLAVPT
jgi:hypothetical protein